VSNLLVIGKGDKEAWDIRVKIRSKGMSRGRKIAEAGANVGGGKEEVTVWGGPQRNIKYERVEKSYEPPARLGVYGWSLGRAGQADEKHG